MESFTLSNSALSGSRKGPLLLVILDGVGISPTRSEGYLGNALDFARTPTLDRLFAREHLNLRLKAHGRAVGLPSDDDMGNSEVGHNAMGAGRVFDQGAKLVNEAIRSGALFRGSTWMDFVGTPQKPGHLLRTQNPESMERGPAIHLIGLLSDGNVHSHIDHLFAMIEQCDQVGVKRLFVHPLLDGRDVEEVSAELYIASLEDLLSRLRKKGRHYYIASGGGRMIITMDRYEANWSWVQRGWETHVLGLGERFPDALTAIESLRKANPGVIDQDLPPFVICDEQQQPRGPVFDDDVVIFFNFRGDRAIEISKAFTDPEFEHFDRQCFPAVHYAGMMEYDGDLHIPPRFLVEPPALERTISEYLVHNNVKSLALSETQKFGHVTYFWNGNNSQKFDDSLETWIEITSDRISFDLKPAMKAYEITDALLAELAKGTHDFLRVNFANGDMVGHTGNLNAAVQALEVVDRNLARLLAAIDLCHGTLVVTADHGNSDQMIEIDKKTGRMKKRADGSFMAKTSHTLAPVPFIVHGPVTPGLRINHDSTEPGLANIAATLLFLLGFTPPSDYNASLLIPA